MGRKMKFFRYAGLIGYLVNLLNILFTAICNFLKRRTRAAWPAKKFWKLEVWAAGRAGVAAEGAAWHRTRFLTGRSFNGVIMTFIMHEFSGGPWTSAVQGPK